MAKKESKRGGYFKNWETPLTAQRPGKDPGPANDYGARFPTEPANPMDFNIGGRSRKK